MERLPSGSVDVLNAALPPLRFTVPSAPEPFMKVTVPVGAPEDTGVTVAVKVTSLPAGAGFSEETSEVEVNCRIETGPFATALAYIMFPCQMARTPEGINPTVTESEKVPSAPTVNCSEAVV